MISLLFTSDFIFEQIRILAWRDQRAFRQLISAAMADQASIFLLMQHLSISNLSLKILNS